MAASSWQEVGLKPELLSALSAMRFNRPSKIQVFIHFVSCIRLFCSFFFLVACLNAYDIFQKAAALPIILGRGGVPKQSFIGQAQSGSGKTAAFVLGFLDQMTPETYTQVIIEVGTVDLESYISS